MKALIILLIVVSISRLSAQINCEIGLGNATGFKRYQPYYQPVKVALSEGFDFFVQPCYRIKNLSFGVRFEYVNGNGFPFPGSSNFIKVNSFSINVRYFLLSGKRINPFLGLGLGTYLFKFSTDSVNRASGTSFGFYPLIGANLGRFCLSAKWNIASDSEQNLDLRNGNNTSNFNLIINPSYLSVTLSFFVDKKLFSGI